MPSSSLVRLVRTVAVPIVARVARAVAAPTGLNGVVVGRKAIEDRIVVR